MNKKTVALTEQQYLEIIKTIRTGTYKFRPNNRIADALVLEANLGIRIGDILRLKLKDIIKDGERYRLDITEEKTGKKREFTVPLPIYQHIKLYCLENGIKDNETIFPITERQVQKHLKMVSDYLELENISTHSFRKFFATNIYNNNNYNILLVQKLLQHSSVSTTQKYIGLQTREIEQALENHIKLA